MKNILVVGGAGYIGSHTCKQLKKRGFNPIVFDNLIYGHKEFVKWGEFILGNLSDKEHLKLLFEHYSIDAVMHFAAFAYVGESVNDPAKYYNNNVNATLCLLDVMKEASVNKFIFSSTCATFGNPEYLPIDEKHPQAPINPYGRSKLMVEQILEDYGSAYGLNYVALRYFNASGADIECEIGEKHDPETHLIPLILDTALGKLDFVSVFGTDYDTEDGTAIRDYIHVNDLAEAHILALNYLLAGGHSDVFNLGNGKGFSVQQVIDCVKQVTQKEFQVKYEPRRVGDPAVLIGASAKIKSKLGWQPKFESLEQIIESAWNWHTSI